MNISNNNVRWLSQYSLLNKLLSQKNGNKISTFNQMRAAISGGVKHKQRNLYYDENGIRWMSKEQADRCITGRSDWKKIVSVLDEVKAELAGIPVVQRMHRMQPSVKGTERMDICKNSRIGQTDTDTGRKGCAGE